MKNATAAIKCIQHVTVDVVDDVKMLKVNRSDSLGYF